MGARTRLNPPPGTCFPHMLAGQFARIRSIHCSRLTNVVFPIMSAQLIQARGAPLSACRRFPIEKLAHIIGAFFRFATPQAAFRFSGARPVLPRATHDTRTAPLFPSCRRAARQAHGFRFCRGLDGRFAQGGFAVQLSGFCAAAHFPLRPACLA